MVTKVLLLFDLARIAKIEANSEKSMRFFKQNRIALQLETLLYSNQKLTEALADVEKTHASLLGRTRAAENHSLSASNRCERIETRLRCLEARLSTVSEQNTDES